MSDQFKELLDLPKDFVKDGTQFLNRCTKRTCSTGSRCGSNLCTNATIADKREFMKITQAVGIGFIIMGSIGYIVKLSMCISLL
jgi:protein transport protein SEC61 subunit gamma and related proteins